jgi:hypothetical protein
MLAVHQSANLRLFCSFLYSIVLMVTDSCENFDRINSLYIFYSTAEHGHSSTYRIFHPPAGKTKDVDVLLRFHG